MNLRGILFFLGIHSFFVSIFSILNIIYSIYFQFYLDLNSYIFCFIISFSLGLLAYFFGKEEKKNITLYDQVALILLSFIYLPLLVSIPYFFSSYGLSFLDSYFEAISGFTGTGFSIIENINSIDKPLLIWRSSSQWIGGLFFLLSIISTLGIKKIKIKPLYLITEEYEGGNFYHNFFVNFGKIFSAYTSITLIIFVLFILSGVRFFDAFNLSFTVASAGGFLQTENLSDIIKNNFQTIILSITLLFSTFNIFLIFRLFSMKLKLKEHLEDFYLLIIIILFVLLLHLFFAPNENLVNILLMITSSISTSGINLHASNLNLSLMLILLTMVGGSVFSTSSGFKFLRIYVLFKSSLNEMYKLTKPINVFNRTLFKSDYKILDEDVKISFLIFIFFIFSIFVLSGLLTINNINFENSFKLSILTLTNTVTSGMFGIYDLNFYELDNFPKISLMIFMILGKLELVAIFMLIKKFILR